MSQYISIGLNQHQPFLFKLYIMVAVTDENIPGAGNPCNSSYYDLRGGVFHQVFRLPDLVYETPAKNGMRGEYYAGFHCVQPNLLALFGYERFNQKATTMHYRRNQNDSVVSGIAINDAVVINDYFSVGKAMHQFKTGPMVFP